MATLGVESCPVCAATDISLIGKTSSQAIIEAYEKGDLRTRVSHLFNPRRAHISLLACRLCDVRWYADAPSGDGEFYRQLQKHDWYYQAEKPEYLFARQAIAEGDKVLEVGCGRGAFARYLPERAVYHGIEFNDSAVTGARSAGLDVEIKAIDRVAAERPNHYDVVCHFQVLEHVADPAAFMMHCAAALKPGGKLVVAVPAEASFVGIAESCWLNMPPHHLTRWTDRALKSICAQVGVSDVQIWHESVAPYHEAWHRDVLTVAGLRSLFSSRPQLRSSRTVSRAKKALCLVPGVGNSLYANGLRAFPQAAHGHTVCAVGRKSA